MLEVEPDKEKSSFKLAICLQVKTAEILDQYNELAAHYQRAAGI
jgi:hypothetical protein